MKKQDGNGTKLKEQQQSYEFTQKLAYYVISIEVVFCGYMLLNADKLRNIAGSSYLFGTCGLAALFGVLWRYFYNEMFHQYAHEISVWGSKATYKLQYVAYNIFVSLSVISFIWTLIAGFIYLNSQNLFP